MNFLTDEVAQDFVVDLAICFVALTILILLMIQFFRRKHRTMELSLFFQMCLSVIFLTVDKIVFDIACLFYRSGVETPVVLFFCNYYVGMIVVEICSVLLLVQWLVFVEYTLHQSRDIIRRRYPAAMIPFVVSVIMMFVSLIDTTVIPNNVLAAIYKVSRIVLAFYIIAPYVILYREKQRNRIPAYIRLTPTTLCIVAGFLTHWFLVGYSTLPLFFAIGLMFADYYMFRRLSYIDPNTGLYNKKYLPVLVKTAKKEELKGATVIRFQVQRGSDIMAMLIKAWSPESSKAIDMGNGEFLVISGALKAHIAERFISLLSENAKEEGIPVKADYETEEGFAENLFQKIFIGPDLINKSP